jgi:hypothetical protein
MTSHNTIQITTEQAAWLTEPCPTCDGNGGFKVDTAILYGIPGGEDWGEMCRDCNGSGRAHRWLAVEGERVLNPTPSGVRQRRADNEPTPPAEWSAVVGQTVELVTACCPNRATCRDFSRSHCAWRTDGTADGKRPVLTCRVERVVPIVEIEDE